MSLPKSPCWHQGEGHYLPVILTLINKSHYFMIILTFKRIVKSTEITFPLIFFSAQKQLPPPSNSLWWHRGWGFYCLLVKVILTLINKSHHDKIKRVVSMEITFPLDICLCDCPGPWCQAAVLCCSRRTCRGFFAHPLLGLRAKS